MLYIDIHDFLFFSKIDETKQIPYKFSNILDNPESVEKLKTLETSTAILLLATHNKSRELLAKLARNIELIFPNYRENYHKRCKDINYWLDKKIPEYEAISKEKISSVATMVFNVIKWPKEKGNQVCFRREKPYSSENDELMKELDDYCEIRDKNGCNILINNKDCLKCNNYIKKMKQHFTSKMQGISSQTDCKWDKYTINCKCTLNDMDSTFPKISCKGLSEAEELKETVPVIKVYSPLEIGFFIIVFFILFYLFILFLEKVK
ncbi:hypothetical protein PVNG_02845 [Plasmodium vivax North Korean]|uniref:PIR Superfamily Protein n=1 Tax=Plasmodium vivax North Korean TaxID=1035514 RepID=A0A0J9TLL0_PLAVI|nr:hypothetical protein PVNG_02845 [Plasmodium vivax North Korean]